MNNLFFMILSIALLIASLYIFKKVKVAIIKKIVFFVLGFNYLLLFSFYGISNYFTGKGITRATIYHIKYNLEGAGFFEYKRLIVLAAFLLMIGTIFLFFFVFKNTKKKVFINNSYLFSCSLLLLSLILNPGFVNIVSILAQNSSFTLKPKLESSVSTEFYDYYRKPYLVDTSEAKKNFVFIYAEGLERTYFNEKLFPGLIKELKKLEHRSTYFTNIKQVAGSGWTIGGLTASQLGIPLFSTSHGNSMSGMDYFLPLAVGLGDLLSKEGYTLTYMGGANLAFAGKGKLFKTHGFNEVLGSKELMKQVKDRSYRTDWGLYDDSLFDLIYERFLELSASKEKFGLFTLTLDTHHPNGHISNTCKGIQYQDGSNPILNAVASSDFLISKFINKIIDSPYADQTVIVLASDHLTLRNSAFDLLEGQRRRNLFMIIEPNEKKATKIQTPGSTLDIGTTILPFIGYNGEIGLGRNLLKNTEKLNAELSIIQNNVENWYKPISKFWDFPRIQDSLKIDIKAELVYIDDRSFKFPILIELNNELETTLRFQFHSGGAKTLSKHVTKMNKKKSFILIDKCENVSKLFQSLKDKKGFCLISGKGKQYSKITKLNKSNAYSFSKNELRNLFTEFKPLRVAHAGGGISNQTYTNSFEALNSNIKKGFQYFELDFIFTSDHRLVCLHDWKDNFNRIFGFKTDKRLTLNEFELLIKTKSKITPCTIDILSEWMINNPTAYIITDIKERNIKGLKILLERIPEAKSRIIPQIYFPENFIKIKELGFEQVIWTLYRYSGSNKQVLEWVDKFYGPFAITMPKERSKSRLSKKLKNRHIPTYVHTINSKRIKDNLLNNFSVTEIYTDFLFPDK